MGKTIVLRRWQLFGIVAIAGLAFLSVMAVKQTSAHNTTVCVLPPSGLVSWWPGDGHADDIFDNNPGALQNGADFATGFVTSVNGQGFRFDGVDDHIIVDNSPNLDFGAASFTVDYWMNSPLTSDNQGHFLKGNGPYNAGGVGWEIRSLGTRLEFARADGTASPAFLHPDERLFGFDLTPDQWHHIAVAYDFPSRTGNLYVDGSLVDSGQFIVYVDFKVSPPVSTGIPSGPYTDNFDLVIGGGTANDDFEGLIDEVEVFDRALTADEIGDIFAAGSAGKCKVEIDITPGSDPNSINPKSNGVIPVAILGSDSFDVNDVDRDSLKFGPSEAQSAHKDKGHLEDVNDDGHMDLVSHYKTKNTGLAKGDTVACVSGQTTGGGTFIGCDSVRVLGK